MTEDRELERVRTFARVLDKYALDPILGLVLPVAGDLVGAILGLYIVAVGIRRRVSKVVIARMVMNLGLDALIGAIPVLGDIADFVFKANEKNVKLLESREAGGRAKPGDWLVLIGAFSALFGAIALVVYAFVKLVQAL